MTGSPDTLDRHDDPRPDRARAAGIWLTQSPLGAAFGFVPLPMAYRPILLGPVTAYLVVTHAAMRMLARHGSIA